MYDVLDQHKQSRHCTAYTVNPDINDSQLRRHNGTHFESEVTFSELDSSETRIIVLKILYFLVLY